MKKVLAKLSAVSLLSFGAIGYTHDVPDCWSEPQLVVKGSYLVAAPTKDLTKEQVVQVLALATGKYRESRNHPSVIGDLIWYETHAVDHGVGQTKLSEEALRAEVEAELIPLTAIPGVTISCNGIIRLPGPGEPQ